MITNSVLEGESWLTTYFEHRTPLKLVQVVVSDGNIPFGSEWIKTEEIRFSPKHKLTVSIQRRKTVDSYVLRMREQGEPSMQWKCLLTNDGEKISNHIERDYSSAIAGAREGLPLLSKTNGVFCNDPLFLFKAGTLTIDLSSTFSSSVDRRSASQH